MESVAFSENVTLNHDLKNDLNDVSKIQFNVNAKEFIPRFLQDPVLSDSEQDETEKKKKGASDVNGKTGENKYKPVFMDGMTEKFIQGPYMGNGRDPEIPYIRYFSNGQTIDFFNKKYFSNSPSGDITFKQYNGNEEVQEPYQTPVFYQNCFKDRNIFRPPIIDALVDDLLFRQQISAMLPKTSPPFYPPTYRRTIKNSNLLNGGSREYPMSSYNVKKGETRHDKKPDGNGHTDSMHEEWLDQNAPPTADEQSETSLENPTATSSPEKKVCSLGDLTNMMNNLSIVNDPNKETGCSDSKNDTNGADSDVWNTESPKEQRSIGTERRRKDKKEESPKAFLKESKSYEPLPKLDNGFKTGSSTSTKISSNKNGTETLPEKNISNHSDDSLDHNGLDHDKEDDEEPDKPKLPEKMKI